MLCCAALCLYVCVLGGGVERLFFPRGIVWLIRRPLSDALPDVDFERHEKVLAPHLARAGCTVKEAPRTGNSPALMHRDDLWKVSPAWSNISIALHGDTEARHCSKIVLDAFV